MEKKEFGITIEGKRYNVKLERNFADFVAKELSDAGINLATDNEVKTLLKAFLRAAKTLYTTDVKLNELIENIEITV